MAAEVYKIKFGLLSRKSGKVSKKEVYYISPKNIKGTYTGEISDGKFHGKGTLVLKSGDTYHGEFQNGKFHGKGKYIWSTGEEYNGEWFEDKKNGKGSVWPAEVNIPAIGKIILCMEKGNIPGPMVVFMLVIGLKI